MRNMMKMALAALVSLALIPTAAAAHTVKGPYSGTVTATTYYPSGGYHGAIDVASSNGCGYWGVETAVVGSVSWNVTIMTTGTVCYGNGYENANTAVHTWADGWKFHLKHFLKTASSYDRTCDRCQVGDEGGTGQATGPHTHLMQEKNGTKDTSWYSGYTTQGEFVDRTETLGVLD
ncbi:hypothetical protein [Hyalangium minutum]|uniref:Peptidase M23 domain-containing protein n=1 Tax=Hyalangium minutum TaxID=394096 RepID=A0A085W536_9BACT|nr:hypothetical protein [Hyalangium minutum]KFE62799.1 hypothetical protein DB31_3913 [Hyalangium minutum]